MKTIEKKQTVYIADDGKEFLNEADCKKYESKTIVRLSKIKYFQVYHDPDLTEGRGFYGRLLIAVETEHYHYHIALDWCFYLYGSPVADLYDSPYENWIISEITAEDWGNYKNLFARVGDYTYPAKRIFISNGMPIDGYPFPCPINPKKADSLIVDKQTGKKNG